MSSSSITHAIVCRCSSSRPCLCTARRRVRWAATHCRPRSLSARSRRAPQAAIIRPGTHLPETAVSTPTSRNFCAPSATERSEPKSPTPSAVTTTVTSASDARCLNGPRRAADVSDNRQRRLPRLAHAAAAVRAHGLQLTPGARCACVRTADPLPAGPALSTPTLIRHSRSLSSSLRPHPITSGLSGRSPFAATSSLQRPRGFAPAVSNTRASSFGGGVRRIAVRVRHGRDKAPAG